jgi:ABC-type Fe3+-hydroxamate transport system substrate-binding protein
MAARVVSLVPSLTEAIAVTAPGLLVGATRYCERPADLGVVRVGGTKNPDVESIAALRPDVVVANEEENRPDDLAALASAGISVLLTEVRSVEQAFTELRRVLAEACGVAAEPRWLAAARAAWDAVDAAAPAAVRTAVVPVWRRPWMVLGRDTFAGDVLARLGVRNLYAGHDERYPRVAVEELREAAPDLVVLPDEPYAFGPDDGPEAFPGIRCVPVSGRHLTWYGPSLGEARAVLGAALAPRP